MRSGPAIYSDCVMLLSNSMHYKGIRYYICEVDNKNKNKNNSTFRNFGFSRLLVIRLLQIHIKFSIKIDRCLNDVHIIYADLY